jgi:hypothetical protein
MRRRVEGWSFAGGSERGAAGEGSRDIFFFLKIKELKRIKIRTCSSIFDQPDSLRVWKGGGCREGG